ncbi:MAG: hypothetical protein ACE5FD_08385, partial [Anaerolineae bacterium]
FAFGQIRGVAAFGSDDPSLILTDWVEDSGLEMTPISKISLWEQDGIKYASQDFEVANDAGDTLLLTSAVIVNGGRYVTFTFGTTAVGVDDYAGLAAAVFDTTVVHYLDPAADLSGQTADSVPTPAPQFTGEIVVTVKEGEQFNLAVLDMATGQMGPFVAEDASDPAWRPGFDTITYSRCAGEICAIFMTNREGALVADETVSFQYGRWSPDGRYLAFTANPDGVTDIYVYDFGVDPPALNQLTADMGNNSTPVWSDTGQFILFTSDRDGDFDIYLMESDGSNQVPVTQNDGFDYAPVLSPNSEKVAYLSDANGTLTIYVFDFVTRETLQLTENLQVINTFTWSPDGRYVAYLASAGENGRQLNIIPADGSGPVIPYAQLAAGPYYELAWRPNPKEVAVEVVQVDFTDPASVLEAIFQSARRGEFSQLATLCDPQGENDGDTTEICTLTAGSESAASFRDWFATGHITGDVVIDGSRAEIPFIFGPDGDQEETMVLIQRDGRWYLFNY